MAAAGERPLNEVQFLTVAEVASVMRVSKMTVYRLVHSGHLPHDPGGEVLPGAGASGSRVPPRELCGGGDSLTVASRGSREALVVDSGIHSDPLDYDLSARTGRLAPHRSYGPMQPSTE